MHYISEFFSRFLQNPFQNDSNPILKPLPRIKSKAAPLAAIALAAASAMLPTSCVSSITAEVGGGKIEAVTNNDFLPSISEFKESLESVLDNEIDMEKEKYGFFSFDTNRLDDMAGDEKLKNIITISENNSKTEKTYDFHINIDNYGNLEEIFPALGNEKVETYLADYNRDMSEDEYLEMIDFVFGEKAAADLKSSVISIAFACGSGFKSYEGLSENEDGLLTTSFRLLDFLLLKKPISFKFTTIEQEEAQIDAQAGESCDMQEEF